MAQHSAQTRIGVSAKTRLRPLLSSLLSSLVIATGVGAVGAGVVGCQTSRLKEFETVRGGMSKSEVIELVGGPQRAQRWHGRDRWEYRFYNTVDGDVIREVHFEDGKSTYVGAAIKPAVSADDQDRLNEAYNHKANAADAESMAHARDGISVERFQPVNDNGDVGPVHIDPVGGAKPSTSQ